MNILFFLTPKSDVSFIYNDFTIFQAIQKIRNHGYTAIPMIDRDGIYIGTVTEGDFLWDIMDHNGRKQEEQKHLPVGQMKRRLENEPVNSCANIEDLTDKIMKQNFVPVIDDNDVFIGIITRQDVLKYLYEQQKSE